MRIFKAAVFILAIFGTVVFTSDPCFSEPIQPQKTKTNQTSPNSGHKPLTMKQLMKQLQLTDDQQKLLHESRAAHRKKKAEIDGQFKVKKVELESEMEKPDPDKVKLALLAQELGELYGQQIYEDLVAKLELEKKILTPQQVEQLNALQAQDNPDNNDGKTK